MSDFNLATADKFKMRDYAKDLGLTLHHALSEENMRDRIIEFCEKNNIDAPIAKVEIGGTRKNTDYIKINIAKQDKPGGSEPAFVGYQGTGFTIPRGIDVEVPAPIVEILKNAVQKIVTQDPETGELHSEPVLTYPFQIIAA